MSDMPLFSEGFAWGDDEGVADVATPVATPDRAATTAGKVGNPNLLQGVNGDSYTPVASVASVADYAWGDVAGDVSQDDVARDATVDATPETAEIRHPDRSPTPPVAGVASVAFWREAVEWMRTNPLPPEMYATSWTTLCLDAAAFVDVWGDDAIRAGWSTIDLFGAHPDPTARRLDTQGLVTLLQGRPVQCLERSSALIGSGREALTYTRQPMPKIAVPVWEVRRKATGQALGWEGSSPYRATPSPRTMSSAWGKSRYAGR